METKTAEEIFDEGLLSTGSLEVFNAYKALLYMGRKDLAMALIAATEKAAD